MEEENRPIDRGVLEHMLPIQDELNSVHLNLQSQISIEEAFASTTLEPISKDFLDMVTIVKE